jgi:hypothetical protein
MTQRSMPNTLAHLGVGAVLTRAFDPRADLKWIFAGCVVPDVPWILQRLVAAIPIHIDPYDLRLYSICQASLMACIILSASLAVVSSQPQRVFLILAGNSALHLILDAFEMKWANGVHLFAPLSWYTLNLGLFWPESAIVAALTAFGFVYVISSWFRRNLNSITPSLYPRWKVQFAIALLVLYFVVPTFFVHNAYQTDAHFVRTLIEVHGRPGRAIEFDRARSQSGDQGSVINTMANEKLALVGESWSGDTVVSVQGNFVDERTVQVSHFHKHIPEWRDNASTVGLVLVFMCWLAPIRSYSDRNSIS